MNRKKAIMEVIQIRQLCSVMNSTKWKELRNEVLENLQFPPAYQIKDVLNDKPYPETFTNSVGYWGDWTEGLLFGGLYAIEWIKVCPKYSKHRGKLIEDEVIDETKEFVSILKKLNIPYKEENGLYIIYGYTNATHQLQ